MALELPFVTSIGRRFKCKIIVPGIALTKPNAMGLSARRSVSGCWPTISTSAMAVLHSFPEVSQNCAQADRADNPADQLSLEPAERGLRAFVGHHLKCPVSHMMR